MTKDYNTLLTSEEAEVDFRFEPGISFIGDLEGQKITNYQIAGEHAAERLKQVSKSNTVLEVCAGIGATTFVLARNFSKVYAIDINHKRLQMCKNNLTRVGLNKNVEFINSDILDNNTLSYLSKFNIGGAYIDVDWTKSDDWRDHESDITKTSPNTKEVYEKVKKYITKNICFKLPKIINIQQVRQLGNCEVESVCPDGKLSFYLVYFGDLVIQESSNFTFPKDFYRKNQSK